MLTAISTFGLNIDDILTGVTSYAMLLQLKLKYTFYCCGAQAGVMSLIIVPTQDRSAHGSSPVSYVSYVS